ncbi:MAG: hypothetical protein IJ604_09000 [Prevotella sp.]|nr:hypothetical protein [Prevotella sp.]
MEIRYKIESMEETGFRYSPNFNYDSIDIDAVTYQFEHNLVPNAEKSELALGMKVEITPGKSNEILAEESVYAIFKIEPFDKVIQIKEGGFRTTETLLIDTFVSIVIGALRGMLIKNLKGTPLAKSVMPLIPMDVIRQNTARLTDSTLQK